MLCDCYVIGNSTPFQPLASPRFHFLLYPVPTTRLSSFSFPVSALRQLRRGSALLNIGLLYARSTAGGGTRHSLPHRTFTQPPPPLPATSTHSPNRYFRPPCLSPPNFAQSHTTPAMHHPTRPSTLLPPHSHPTPSSSARDCYVITM